MVYRPGDYFVICDQCGFQRYASDCQMTWNNLFVCTDTCWESKHEHFTPPKPQGEKQSVPVLRKEDKLNFISTVDDSTLEANTDLESPKDGYFITTPITGDDL